jgi:ABC-2 type transport system ATP-binding protein
MLEAKNISVSFRKNNVLQGISLSVEQGSIVGLVAPNGLGKTTLLRTLSGLIIPKSGSIKVDGIPPKNKARFQRKIFFVEDSQVLNPALCALDYLTYVKRMWHSRANISKIVKTLRIVSFARKPIRTLSLGMKQQVIIALCLVSEAPYVLLDEPMNGLDPSNTHIISQQLERMCAQGRAVLMSSHLLGNIDALADTTYFIKDGKVAYTGTRTDGRTSADVYMELYLAGEVT